MANRATAVTDSLLTRSQATDNNRVVGTDHLMANHKRSRHHKALVTLDSLLLRGMVAMETVKHHNLTTGNHSSNSRSNNRPIPVMVSSSLTVLLHREVTVVGSNPMANRVEVEVEEDMDSSLVMELVEVVAVAVVASNRVHMDSSKAIANPKAMVSKDSMEEVEVEAMARIPLQWVVVVVAAVAAVVVGMVVKTKAVLEVKTIVTEEAEVVALEAVVDSTEVEEVVPEEGHPELVPEEEAWAVVNVVASINLVEVEEVPESRVAPDMIVVALSRTTLTTIQSLFRVLVKMLPSSLLRTTSSRLGSLRLTRRLGYQ